MTEGNTFFGKSETEQRSLNIVLMRMFKVPGSECYVSTCSALVWPLYCWVQKLQTTYNGRTYFRRIMYIMKNKEFDWFKDKAKNLAQCWN